MSATGHPDRHQVPLAPLLGIATRIGIEQLHRGFEEAGFRGIRPAHGCVFRFIDIDEGSRLTELAKRSQLTKQAVGEAADQLENLGYVERVPDPHDRRAKIIRLTDRGRQAHAAGLQIFADIERHWSARYGKQRIALLRELLEELSAHEGHSGQR